MTVRFELEGFIAAAGFASGDRFVVGVWQRSPLGPFADVMWADATDRRRLIAPTERVARFVTAIYPFDDTLIADVEAAASLSSVTVAAGPLELRLRGGSVRRIPIRRPAWFTRWVEAPVARRLMGVEVYGTTPSSVREWYRADAWSWVGDGTGRLHGVDLGALRPLDPPVRFGFSEPPRDPSIVAVRTLLEAAAGVIPL